MHIKRDISTWNFKMILNVLIRMPGSSGRSKWVLTIFLLSATIQNNNTLCKTSQTSQITNEDSIVG